MMTGILERELLNSTLWTVQVLLLLAFGVGAGMKLLMPISRLSDVWPWTGVLSKPLVRSLGVVDLVGGVGVVFPMLTHVLPALTVAAAVGCMSLQICAMVFHLSRREASALPVNFVLLAMATFVAWGRWGLL